MQRSALVMLAIVAVLGVGVYLLQTRNPAAPENATTYALNVSPGNVSRIDVTTAGKSTAFERLDPVGWKFADSGNQADTSREDSVVNRLAMLDGPHRCHLLGGKRASIHREDADVVLLQKLAHRLSRRPQGAPYRRSRPIGQDQPRIRPTDQVDTAGQFIKYRL